MQQFEPLVARAPDCGIGMAPESQAAKAYRRGEMGDSGIVADESVARGQSFGQIWQRQMVRDAAATLGASRRRILLEITVPLLRGGLVAAFLFAFITSFDDLTVALFVSGGVTVTLPKQMWDDMILQLNPTLAAVSTVVFVLVTALLVTAEWTRRRGASR